MNIVLHMGKIASMHIVMVKVALQLVVVIMDGLLLVGKARWNAKGQRNHLLNVRQTQSLVKDIMIFSIVMKKESIVPHQQAGHIVITTRDGAIVGKNCLEIKV